MLHGIVDLLFGCRHKRTTRPITPVRKGHSAPGETYVSCLECGRRLRYDLTIMKVGKPVPMTEPGPAVKPFQSSND